MIDPSKIFNFSSDDRLPNSNREIKIQWTVPADLPYFEGHFPENPILPGVAIIDLVQILIQKKIKSLKSVKFTEVVKPLDTLNVVASQDESTLQWSVNITNQREQVVCKISLATA